MAELKVSLLYSQQRIIVKRSTEVHFVGDSARTIRGTEIR